MVSDLKRIENRKGVERIVLCSMFSILIGLILVHVYMGLMSCLHPINKYQVVKSAIEESRAF